jgi:hypothetical protein
MTRVTPSKSLPAQLALVSVTQNETLVLGKLTACKIPNMPSVEQKPALCTSTIAQRLVKYEYRSKQKEKQTNFASSAHCMPMQQKNTKFANMVDDLEMPLHRHECPCSHDELAGCCHDASSRSQSPVLYMCALGVSSTCCFSSFFLTAMMNSWMMVIRLAKPPTPMWSLGQDYSSLQSVFLINLILWRAATTNRLKSR